MRCTFRNGPVDCTVHTQVAEVAVALEHEHQRGPSEQDAGEAQTLEQTRDQCEPVTHSQSSACHPDTRPVLFYCGVKTQSPNVLKKIEQHLKKKKTHTHAQRNFYNLPYLTASTGKRIACRISLLLWSCISSSFFIWTPLTPSFPHFPDPPLPFCLHFFFPHTGSEKKQTKKNSMFLKGIDFFQGSCTCGEENAGRFSYPSGVCKTNSVRTEAE